MSKNAALNGNFLNWISQQKQEVRKLKTHIGGEVLLAPFGPIGRGTDPRITNESLTSDPGPKEPEIGLSAYLLLTREKAGFGPAL